MFSFVRVIKAAKMQRAKHLHNQNQKRFIGFLKKDLENLTPQKSRVLYGMSLLGQSIFGARHCICKARIGHNSTPELAQLTWRRNSISTPRKQSQHPSSTWAKMCSQPNSYRYHSFSPSVLGSLGHLHYEWEQAIVSPNNKKQREIGSTYALVRHSGENDVPNSR